MYADGLLFPGAHKQRAHHPYGPAPARSRGPSRRAGTYVRGNARFWMIVLGQWVWRAGCITRRAWTFSAVALPGDRGCGTCFLTSTRPRAACAPVMTAVRAALVVPVFAAKGCAGSTALKLVETVKRGPTRASRISIGAFFGTSALPQRRAIASHLAFPYAKHAFHDFEQTCANAKAPALTARLMGRPQTRLSASEEGVPTPGSRSARRVHGRGRV